MCAAARQREVSSLGQSDKQSGCSRRWWEKIKRTINNFFVKNVKLRPDPSENRNQCSDMEPSTSQVMSSTGLETALDNEPHTIESEPGPTKIKRGKMYTFRREWVADSVMHCIYIYQTLLSKATYSAFRLYIFCQYVCSLGIEPTTFCAANRNTECGKTITGKGDEVGCVNLNCVCSHHQLC